MPNILKVNMPGDYCRHVGIPSYHPLVAVVDFKAISPMPSSLNSLGVYGLFMHSRIREDVTYGSRPLEGGDGSLVCVAPGQLYGREDVGDLIDLDGWGLIFHPNLLVGNQLEREIRNFTFFDYSANEALMLIDNERELLTSIVNNIQYELQHGTDDKNRDSIIIGYLSVMLHHCNRFYNRQFIAMLNSGNDMLVQFNNLLNDYFDSGRQLVNGIPGVQYFADKMNMSSNYFSDLIKKLSGESPGNIIRNHIIRLAKNMLIAKGNVSQVAYDLGFDYPQHFTRMFKKHTGMTPKQFHIGE